MKISGFIKNIALVSMVAIFSANSIAAMAEVIVGDNIKHPPPGNANEILKNIRDIIVHGDLSDEQYYSEKLGVVMKGTDAGEVYAWGPMCGKVKTNRLGQYFNNLDVPWYFDSAHKFVNKCGGYPYRKETLPNGKIQVNAFIYVDISKVCFSVRDVDQSLENIKHNNGPYNKNYMYMFDGENSIGLIVLSPGTGKCVGIVSLFQNDN